MTEQFANNAVTTLAATINNSTTTVTIASATNFPSSGNYRIKIDSEIMLVTARSGTSLTVTRAAESTTAASHTIGATVAVILTASALSTGIVESGQNFNQSASYSSIPSAGTAGRLFYPTNSTGLIFRDNGTTWDGFGPIFGPFQPPVSDFTNWLNQGTRGSLSTTNGTVYIADAGPAANSENIIGRYKTAPSTPWTMTVALIPNWPPSSSANAGIFLRNSSNGKITGFAVDVTVKANIWRWDSPTVFNSSTINQDWYTRSSPIAMLRIVNDGTTLSYQLSNDFVNWNTWYSENVSGNFLATIDNVGYYINTLTLPLSNASTCGVNFLHAATT